MSFKPIPSLSGDNASFVGDVLGTGDGNRITNDGIPYLISGDSPAETQNLDEVLAQGNTSSRDMQVETVTGFQFEATGEVGLYLSGPYSKIRSNGGITLQTDDTDTRAVFGDNYFYLKNKYSANDVFRMVGGNAIIGSNTTPLAKLDVRGDITGLGDFLGTGIGNRITNNGVPYLLSGDSPAENDTLQDVTTRGNSTSTSILSTGPHISGVTGLFSDKIGIGTNSPSYGLHLKTNPDIFFEGNIAQNDYLFDGGGENLTVFRDPDNTNRTYLTFDKDDQLYVGRQGSVDFIVNGASSLKTLIQTDASENDVFFPDGKYGFGFEGVEPSALVHVSGDSFFDGDVGIGTALASKELDVVGDIEVRNSYDAVNVGSKFNVATGNDSVAFGIDNLADGPNSLAIGKDNDSHGNRSIAIGVGNDANVNDGVVVGQLNTVNADAVVVGRSNDVGQGADISIGYGNWVSGTQAVGVGVNNTVSGNYAQIFGRNNEGQFASVIYGGANTSQSSNGILFGQNNDSSGDSQAFGKYNYVTGTESTAIGRDNVIDTHNALAAGWENKVYGSKSAAVGYRNIVSGSDSSALGHYAVVGTNDTIEIGQYNSSREREGAVRIHDNHLVAISMRSGTAPSASTANDGFESETSLASDMYTIQRNGSDYILYHNLGGSIESTTLGATEADTLQSVTTRGNETTTSIISTGPYISGVTGLFSNQVGIGTTSPSEKLEIKSTVGTNFQKFNTTTNGNVTFGVFNADSRKSFRVNSDNGSLDLKFRTSSNRIYFGSQDDVQEVGINTVDPQATLHVHSPDSSVLRLANNEAVYDSSQEIGIDFYGRWYSSQTSVLKAKASIVALGDTDGYQRGQLSFRVANDAAPSEVVRINRQGNVGIGTTSPSQKLDVQGTILVNNEIQLVDSNMRIFRSSNDLRLRTGGNDRVTINSAGNVGIGTTSPASLLNVVSSGNGTTALTVQDEARKIKIGRDSVQVSDLSNTATTLYLNSGGGNVSVPVSSFTVGATGPDSGVKLQVTGHSKFKGDSYHSHFNYGSSQDTYIRGGKAGSLVYINDLGTSDVGMVAGGGNVGIGTNSPAGKLEIKASTYAGTIKFKQPDGSAPFVSSTAGTAMVFQTYSGVDKAAIYVDNSGNFTIGGADIHLDGVVSGDRFKALTGGSLAFPSIQLDDTNGDESGLYLPATNQIGVITDRLERLRIDASGNVGIGTASPDSRLELAVASTADMVINANDRFKIKGNGTATWGNSASNGELTWDSGYAIIKGQSGNGLKLAVNNSTNTGVTINTSGKVGIGTTDPQNNLHVIGTLRVGPYFSTSDRDHLLITPGGTVTTVSTPNETVNYDNSAGNIHIRTNSGYNTPVERLTVLAGGNVGIGTTNPSDNLTVEGGGITLGGTGRIQGVDTVTDATDAANKAYVDAQVGSADTLQEVTDNGNTTTNNISIGTTNTFTVGGTAKLSVSGLISWGASNSDLSYFRRLSAGNFQWQTYNGGNSGNIHLQPYGGNVGIGTSTPAYKLDVNGDLRAVGAAHFNGNAYLSEYLYHAGDANTSMRFTDDSIQFNAGGVTMLKMTEGSADVLTVNPDSNNISFQVNGVGAANALFVRGSDGNVGIGTSSPSAKLEVAGSSSNGVLVSGGSNDRNTKLTASGLVYSTTSSSGWAMSNYVVKNSDGSALGQISGGFGSANALTYTYYGGTAYNDAAIYILSSNKNVGIGAASPSVGLQLGSSVLGQTKTAIFNSEGGSEVGLTIRSRTNRARLRVADNDSNAYVIAEAGKAFFGTSSNGNADNITVTGGDLGIGTTSPSEKLEVSGNGKFSGTLTITNDMVINSSGDRSITWGTNDLAFISGTTVGLRVMPDELRVNTKFGLHNAGGLTNNTELLGMELEGSQSTHYSHAIFAVPQANHIPTNLYIRGEDGAYGGGSTKGVSVYIHGGDNTTSTNQGDVILAHDGASGRGNVGIGTTTPSAKLEVNGHFAATSKSFIIDHPTKEDKKLQYASLEGPENGVYVRGTTDKETIELPEYWSELVHEDSITVVLTPIGKKQDLFIKEKSNKLIKIGGAEGSFDYVVYGERKDIDKLEIEPLKV